MQANHRANKSIASCRKTAIISLCPQMTTIIKGKLGAGKESSTRGKSTKLAIKRAQGATHTLEATSRSVILEALSGRAKFKDSANLSKKKIQDPSKPHKNNSLKHETKHGNSRRDTNNSS
jgi:hypothetical protein